MTTLNLVTINRTHHREDGTFGTLDIDGLPICLTLERKWQNNEKGVSCIPAGSYLAKRIQSPKFGNTFEVTSVPSRANILIHWGNIDMDSQGCILLGESFNIWKTGQCSVASSKIAFAEFCQRLEHVDSFILEINNITFKE